MQDFLVEFELAETEAKQKALNEMEAICSFDEFVEKVHQYHDKKKPDYIEHLKVCQAKYQNAKTFAEKKKRYDIYEAGKRIIARPFKGVRPYEEWVTEHTLESIKRDGIDRLIQREYTLGFILI